MTGLQCRNEQPGNSPNVGDLAFPHGPFCDDIEERVTPDANNRSHGRMELQITRLWCWSII